MDDEQFNKSLQKLSEIFHTTPMTDILAKTFAEYFDSGSLNDSLSNLDINMNDAGVNLEDVILELITKFENLFDELLDVSKVEYNDGSVSGSNRVKLQSLVEIIKSMPVDLQRHVVGETLHRMEKDDF